MKPKRKRVVRETFETRLQPHYLSNGRLYYVTLDQHFFHTGYEGQFKPNEEVSVTVERIPKRGSK